MQFVLCRYEYACTLQAGPSQSAGPALGRPYLALASSWDWNGCCAPVHAHNGVLVIIGDTHYATGHGENREIRRTITEHARSHSSLIVFLCRSSDRLFADWRPQLATSRIKASRRPQLQR